MKIKYKFEIFYPPTVKVWYFQKNFMNATFFLHMYVLKYVSQSSPMYLLPPEKELGFAVASLTIPVGQAFNFPQMLINFP